MARAKTSECPNGTEHTPQPRGYLEWHEWAEEKSKTHLQEKCPGCGLYEIWVPREDNRA